MIDQSIPLGDAELHADEPTGSTEAEIAELLEAALCMYQHDTDPMDECGFDAVSFADAGVLTSNEGLVLSLAGQEFQITVVRSR